MYRCTPSSRNTSAPPAFPVLAAWGKNDVIFVAPGAEAFARDVKKLELRLVDAAILRLKLGRPNMLSGS